MEFDLFKNSFVDRCFFLHLNQFLSVVESVVCCYWYFIVIVIFLFSRISLLAFEYYCIAS